MWRIKLTLQGGLVVVLNDVREKNPGWTDSNPPGITKIEFSFTGRIGEHEKEVPHTLVISNMKEYNFFIEANKEISGGRISIKGLWFLGKLPDCKSITGFVIGDTIKIVNASVGKEYRGMPTGGWKQGIIQGTPISHILRKII